MPVIVVGADTPIGEAIVDALRGRDGEIRAFVTSPDAAESLKSRRVKVAIGDVSDASHVEGASTNCFCAVLVTDAAQDDRERAFAAHPAAVVAGWQEAVRASAVSRVLWVAGDVDAPPPMDEAPERAVVATRDRRQEDVATEVARLEDAADLSGR